jgi:hypothetical protein
MQVFSRNTKGSLRRANREPNIPKSIVRNEFQRKVHIRLHDFQLAPHMTPDDTRIYTRVKL